MFLAFRLFGNFHWPPVPERPLETPDQTQAGVIEIFFGEKAGGRAGTFTALLRWCPGRVEGGTGTPAPDVGTPSLFGLDQKDALNWFEGTRDAEGIIWLDGDKATKIAFRGAFLLEQYGEQYGDAPLQWPLVSQVKYVTDSMTHTALMLYRYRVPLFRFNLNLPLPVLRRVESGLYTDATAFPFCVVYNAVSKSDSNPPSPHTIVAGWIEADATADTADTGGVQSYILNSKETPADSRLGRFGFATQQDGKKYFAVLAGRGDGSVPIERMWPANLKVAARQILQRYGFSISGNGSKVDLVDKYGNPALAANALSIRFENDRLIYRVAIPTAFTSGSDITAASGAKLQVRLAQELGGPVADRVHYDASTAPVSLLALGKTLLVDCEMSWSIEPGKIWPPTEPSGPGHDGRDWNAKVSLRLIWSETVNTFGSAAASPSTPLPLGLLALANYSLATTRDALVAGEAGMPHSFLPEIVKIAGSSEIRFCLHGSPIEAVFDQAGSIAWGRATDPEGWSRPPMRLTLADAQSLGSHLEGEAETEIAVHLTNISFFQTDGVRLHATLAPDLAWPPASAAQIRDGDPYFASYRLILNKVETADGKSWRGRLGALQFKGDPGTIKSLANLPPDGYLRIGREGGAGSSSSPLLTLVYPQGAGAVEITVPVPANRVDQITADVERFDRTGRPGPLLVPISKGSPARGNHGVTPYWLFATEHLASRQDRWLEANVFDLTEAAADGEQKSYVILSQEPFSVLKFTQSPLGSRGDAASASVATYSGDTRLWQYKVVSPYYHYVLPPQVVGESADKPRRLEIHDLQPGSTELPPRPYATESYPDDPKGTPLDLRRRAVDFRLTPSAEIWISPSDVERGYFVPESTSYEIFRQYGEYGLGAQLSYLRAEFLYGLSVGIDVSKETGISRGARIAEIEALTGRLPGRGGANAAPDQRNRWSAVRAAVARRPERLEVWARNLDSTVAFTRARFTDGVRFSLRGTALHRHPIGPDGKVSSIPSVGGQEPKDLTLDKPRHHPQGLSGGAIWPVESNNLFNTLVSSPRSRGGVIQRIALSPMGGDAQQKAEFLDGKVTIISETYNGQVQRQQVEVLGRICCLWHRAKHVVVYERTVNPTAQFAPLYEEDPHRTRTRRPVLRKVREYIELMQDERNYPDFANAEQRSSGFLERVRFNSRIINVDSAWGRDIGDFGWMVPLWNRLASRQRPQVYPMPDVAFGALAEGEGDRPTVSLECLDSDFLFFFADFKAATSDTDLWVSRLGLDYANVPPSASISKFADKASADQRPQPDDFTEGRRRPVGRFLPGLRQFTWRLAPAAQKAALNAGRSAKPVYVDLNSVTFVRATHAPDQALRPDLEKVVADGGDINRNSDEARRLAKVAYWQTDGSGAKFDYQDLLQKVTSQSGDLKKAIDANNWPKVDELLKDFKGTNWTTIKPKLAGYLAGLADQGDLKPFKDITGVFKQGGKFCDKLKQDAVDMVKRKEMLLRTAIHDAVGAGDALLESLPINKSDLAGHLHDLAIEQIRLILSEASADIGKLDEGVEQMRAMLLDLEAEIEAVFARARQRVKEFSAGYERDKPWSEARRIAFRNGLAAAVNSVADDIRAAIDECRQRLGVELNNVSQAVAGHVARLLAEAAEARLETNIITAKVGAAVDQIVGRVDRALAELTMLIGQATKSKLDLLLDKAQSIQDTGVKDAVVEALGKIKDYREDALQRIATARELAAKVDDIADRGLEGFDAALQAALTAVSQIGNQLATNVAVVANALYASADEFGQDAANWFRTLIVEQIGGELDRIATFVEGPIKKIGGEVDSAVAFTAATMEELRVALLAEVRKIPDTALPIIDDVRAALASAEQALSPDALVETLIAGSVVDPAIARLLQPLPDTIDVKIRELAGDRLMEFEGFVGDAIRDLQASALGTLAELSAACSAVYEGVDEVARRLQEMGDNFQRYVDAELEKAYENFVAALGPFPQEIKDAKRFAEKLLGAVKSFDYSVRRLQNDLSRSFETAGSYADRVLDLAGKIDEGGLMAAPSNLLKLYSAVTSAPEIAALKADIDRIRSDFDELSDLIQTTKANALFNRLGDELKGLGLSLPFDQIGERLLPADLSGLDIGKVFRNFGGAKLDRLFSGYKIPPGVRDAVKITHDFDKKQARAWVQVDINAPMPGRRSLFSVGVFKADFVDMQLVGQVRLEASKDQDKVTQTGFGRIATKIDMVAGGQSMVCFENFGLNFTKEKGLDVEFDPSNIRLNPQFKFIQDFLSTLFGGDPGGLTIITEGGLPVGVEHLFTIPPVSLNFGTSGVQNVSIENRFKLVAFPDFMLADRFNLSILERPFIFAIFIIGGTGYIQLEAQYRPFANELTVLVEAGAGGSASLAFAFGPFSGQVFITLSGTLSYRKLIGKPGGGLAVSVVLVIAGHVDVAGIITVGITLTLRMTYRDSGQVDGDGSLSVTIRISRFFKLTARANVKYKLRGGKSETKVSTSVDSEQLKLEKAKQVVDKLEKVRN